MENESQKLELTVSSTKNTSQTFKMVDVRTIQEFMLRPQTLAVSKVQSRYAHLTRIPFDSYTEVSSSILIGLLDNVQLGNAVKRREGNPSEPINDKTRLGWTAYGNCSPSRVCECNVTTDENHEAIKNEKLFHS